MTPDHIEQLRRKVAWAQRKCDEAAASDKPWALGNLRLYQNKLVQYMRELAEAEKAAGIAPPDRLDVH